MFCSVEKKFKVFVLLGFQWFYSLFVGLVWVLFCLLMWLVHACKFVLWFLIFTFIFSTRCILYLFLLLLLLFIFVVSTKNVFSYSSYDSNVLSYFVKYFLKNFIWANISKAMQLLNLNCILSFNYCYGKWFVKLVDATFESY
jgi:hypothetical protein